MTWSTDDEHSPRFAGSDHAISFLSARGDSARLRSALAPAHRRRRGAQAHVDQGRNRRLLVVARWKARRARTSRLHGGRRQRAASDRARSPAVQAGHRWLSGQSPHASLALRRRDAAADAAHQRQSRRDDAGVVARRLRHPLLVEAGKRIRIAPTTGTSSSSRPSPARPRAQLTHNDLDDGDPQWESRSVWSPDSKEIAFLQGGPDSLLYFGVQHLAVVPAAGGPVRVVSSAVDRNFVHPAWSGDGQVDLRAARGRRLDDPRARPARGRHGAARARRRTKRRRRSRAPARTWRSCRAPSHIPDELFAIDGDSARQLSDANPWLRDIQLATQEPISDEKQRRHGSPRLRDAPRRHIRAARDCPRSSASTAAPSHNGTTGSSCRGRCSPHTASR